MITTATATKSLHFEIAEDEMFTTLVHLADETSLIAPIAYDMADLSDLSEKAMAKRVARALSTDEWNVAAEKTATGWQITGPEWAI